MKLTKKEIELINNGDLFDEKRLKLIEKFVKSLDQQIMQMRRKYETKEND